MIVRWLGAYGHGSSLESSLQWELTQCDREVAAERFATGRGYAARYRHGEFTACVGLRLAKGALIRRFPGDVYSRTGEDGRLVPSRYASGVDLCGIGRHEECFCRPVYDAIVCREHPARMGRGVAGTLARVAAQYGLPILVLDKDGRRKRVDREGRKR